VNFEQARKLHAEALRAACAELCKICTDPNWCNTNYPPYKKAMETITRAVDALERLNACQVEAEHLERHNSTKS
jgi:sugar phosphate isomerase/epimerase